MGFRVSGLGELSVLDSEVEGLEFGFGAFSVEGLRLSGCYEWLSPQKETIPRTHPGPTPMHRGGDGRRQLWHVQLELRETTVHVLAGSE